jgi:nickel-dependent lactate racemase
MRVAVDYQDEQLDLEVPDERLVAEWHGPAGVAASDVPALVRDALESPRQYPPLRQAVVPGDRVVVATDLEAPEIRGVLAEACATLEQAGVEADAITVLAAPGAREVLAHALPKGVALAVHDPGERKAMAYLANTSEGRRVYLNRLLTDADFVLPIGRLGYDPVFGYRGPWSLIFPGLSDVETARTFRSRTTADWPDRDRPRPALAESTEVSWLLGCQFHVGIVASASGTAEAVAGLDSAVRDEGARAVDRAWTFEAESRAGLVVVGIGRPGIPTRIEDVAEGLANAARLVERGGKIVALSRAEGPIGPAFRRLIDVDDPRLAPAALRGLEAEPDYIAAQLAAQAIAWADVYLLSGLEPDAVEDSSIIRLDRAEDVRRLVANSRTCLFLSQAESARARVADEAD